MASTHAVCSMCGDVGFPDKLFRCSRCRSRFQHSYCTNFYHELPAGSAGVCDWCLSEGRIGDKYELPLKKSERRDSAEAAGRRTAYAKGDKVKQSGRGDDSDGRGSSGSSTSSSKPAGRRYKLLKDVLC